jgi:TonB family protein
MLAAFVLPVLLLDQAQRPLNPNEPPPQGQRIEAKDGDTVIISGGARVRVVRRTEGTVRIIYNAANRWIAILYEAADASGAPPDGKVDGSLRFEEVDGVWPLGERWQGSAVVDEYQMTQGMLRIGVGVTTDAGSFQLFAGSPASPPANSRWFQDPHAAAVLYYGSGGGGGTSQRMSFDQAEQFVTQQAARDVQMREASKGNPSQIGGYSTSVNLNAESGAGGVRITPGVGGMAPVRVGGSIRIPQKIADAQPVYPPIAQSARVTGVVILEITIGSDGSVMDAKVLRSIPLLDQAALDCVRKWKYEPTLLNGTAVPVIMTVTVNFALQGQ